MERLCYLSDGTLEGMLTAIHVAFEQGDTPDNIIVDDSLQSALFNTDIPVHTNLDHADDMRSSIIEAIGASGYDNVKKLFLSDSDQRGGITFRYLAYTIPNGRKSLGHIAHPAVADAADLLRKVQKEAQYMVQFIRFADIGGGLYYAHITPQANVVPLIMGHFSKRFNIQPFIIHDPRHCLSGVFDTKKWWLVEGVPQGISLPTAIEDRYQELWQRFYKTIAIPERKNLVVQRGFMPKRFWGDMCEQRVSYTKRRDGKHT